MSAEHYVKKHDLQPHDKSFPRQIFNIQERVIMQPSQVTAISISNGLIVDQPWLEKILSGAKTWEMRSKATRKRGWIALIEKGSGQVKGVAKLVDSLPAQSPEQLLLSLKKHHLPAGQIQDGTFSKWNTPWVLEHAHALRTPVPYQHPPGAVIWVKLDEAVAHLVATQV